MRRSWPAFREARSRITSAAVPAAAYAPVLLGWDGVTLADGLWLEQSLAPDLMSPERAKVACRMLLGQV